MSISFHVAGLPQTKGSLRQWHRHRADGNCLLGISEQGGPRLGEWRALVATAAKRAMRQAPPLDGPIAVELTFIFPRPKKQAPEVADCPYVWGNRRWDLDKLQRAIFDAMTDAAVWNDDSQVAHVMAEKRYKDPYPGGPGCNISVEPLT